MVWHLFSAKPLPEPMITCWVPSHHLTEPNDDFSSFQPFFRHFFSRTFCSALKHFHWRKPVRKCHLQNFSLIIQVLMSWFTELWASLCVVLLIGPWGIWLQSQISKFQTHFKDKYLKYFLWNCYQVNATAPHWSLINIGSGNGLVPSGNKQLPKPMLT